MTNITVLPAIHPGEILQEEYLQPLNLSPYALAQKLNVPRTRIERLVAEKTGLSADTALRLAKFFNTSPQFWLNMQMLYDLKQAEKAVKNILKKIEPRLAA